MKLPHGERAGDPPIEEQGFRFRMGLAIRRANPLVVAFTVSLVVCMIPLGFVLAQNSEIKGNQRSAQHQRFEAVSRLCGLTGVVKGVLEKNPQAVVPPEAQKALDTEDCNVLLAKAFRALGKHATPKEKKQLDALKIAGG